MARLLDPDSVRLETFPDGVHNVGKETALPQNEQGRTTALRAAVNLDLDSSGRVQMRRGHVVQVAQAAHSLHATPDHLFAVVEGALRAYRDGAVLELASTIRAGLGARFVSYATHGEDTYWSNGLTSGRIDAALADRAFWIDTPDPPQVSATATGGMAAGSYEVAVTALDRDGRESGASPLVVVDVAVDGGVALVMPATPADAVQWRVYISAPDGEVLYLAASLPLAAVNVSIGHGERGKALETAWMNPLPAGETLRYWNGRLLVASRNVLMWSASHRIGLMHPDNYMTVGAEISLLEPLGDGEGAGVYVADHKRTYYLSGGDPHAWNQVIRYPHAAVPGTGLTVPGSVFGLETTAPVAFWLARNGVFCLGLPGGQVQPLRETGLALPIDSERGATGYFAFDGIRQIVTSILSGEANPVAFGDSASATIRRNGQTVA